MVGTSHAGLVLGLGGRRRRVGRLLAGFATRARCLLCVAGGPRRSPWSSSSVVGTTMGSHQGDRTRTEGSDVRRRRPPSPRRGRARAATARPSRRRTPSGGRTTRVAPRDAAARSRVWGTVASCSSWLAGVLFTANARLAGGVDARQPQDLAGLVEAEADRPGTLADEVDELQAEVDAAHRRPDGRARARSDAELAELIAFAAGRVRGHRAGPHRPALGRPGERAAPGWVTNDYLVVHQQDLQAVINALWAGGAEAMTPAGPAGDLHVGVPLRRQRAAAARADLLAALRGAGHRRPRAAAARRSTRPRRSRTTSTTST